MPMVNMPYKGEVHNLKDVVKWIVIKRGGRAQPIPIRPRGSKKTNIDHKTSADQAIENKVHSFVKRYEDLPRNETTGFHSDTDIDGMIEEIKKSGKDVILFGIMNADRGEHLFHQALKDLSPLSAEALEWWGGNQPEITDSSPRGVLASVAKAWKFNGRSVGGSLMQLVAANVMGVEPKLFFTENKIKERLEEFVKFFSGTQYMKNLEIGIRAQYAETQAMLSKTPGDTLELWRGVRKKYNVTATAESWAMYKETAEKYDDAGVFKVPIDKKSIFVHAKSKIWLSTHDPHGFYDEGDEWVTIGAKWSPVASAKAMRIKAKRETYEDMRVAEEKLFGAIKRMKEKLHPEISDESKRTLYKLKKMSKKQKAAMVRELG